MATALGASHELFLFLDQTILFLTPFALFSHEIVRILQGAVPWVLIGIIADTLFFSQLWCSVLCPTGILLSLIARLRLFRYQVAGNCVQCGKCTANCSVGTAPNGTGVAKEGCLACQEVCPTGAIAKVPSKQVKMGSAVIDKERCIAWNGNKLCFICGELCPLVAIEIDDQNRPTVLLDKCCHSCNPKIVR